MRKQASIGRRTLGSRNERGTAAVEFALIAPLSSILVFGMLDFGWVFSQYLSVRDAVREGARQGAVEIGTYANTSHTCALTGATGSNDVQDLMCDVHALTGVGTSLRVKVLFDNSTLSASGSTYTVGNAVVVCAEYPLGSLSGLFTSALGGKFIEDEAVFRIEQAATDGQTETAGAETAPTGASWSWCTK